MRRRQSVLYQALTVPPPTAVRIPPSFDWFKALSDPARYLRDPDFWAQQAAGAVNFPAVQPSIDARTTRWYRQWVDPPRILKDPDNAAQAASGLTFAAAIQPSLDARNARWHRPFSEPQRFAGGWADQGYLQALISGESAPPAIQPTNDNKNARWFQPLSEPLRFKGGWPDGRYNTALAASGESTYPIKQTLPVVITLDMWYAEWRLQPRYMRDPRYTVAFAAGEVPWPYAQPAADNANTRWFSALSEPRRESRFVARLAGEVAPWPFDSVFQVVPLAWWRALSEPQRFLRDPRFWATLTATGEAPWSRIQANPVSIAWWKALSEPQRFLRDPGVASALATSGLAPWGVFFPPDLQFWWFSQLSEPQRFPRDLRAAVALMASGPAPSGNALPTDPLSLPRRPLLRLGGSAYATYWPSPEPHPPR